MWLILGSSAIIILVLNVGLGFQANIATGDSMEPYFSNGCTFVFGSDVGVNNLDEGDIGVYKSERDGKSDRYVIHRVHRVYDKYDSEESKYTVRKVRNKLVFTDGEKYVDSRLNRSELMNIEGKKVYIFKGDNNDWVDPELVTQDQIKVKILDPHIELPQPINSMCRP